MNERVNQPMVIKDHVNERVASLIEFEKMAALEQIAELILHLYYGSMMEMAEGLVSIAQRKTGEATPESMAALLHAWAIQKKAEKQ